MHSSLRAFDSEERRRILWLMLMGATALKNKKGLEWLAKQYRKFIRL